MKDKLIVFDIGNVLLRFDVGRAARNFDRLHPGKGPALADFVWGPEASTLFETGRLSGPDLFSRAVEAFRLELSYAQFCEAFNDIFTPVEENLSLLESLARRHAVALLSNTNPIHWSYIFDRYPALKAARWPFSSHILGALKPDPGIYRSLSEKTGFPLDRMVYVDDREDFIRAADRLGVTALLFDGEQPLRPRFERLGLFSENGKSH